MLILLVDLRIKSNKKLAIDFKKEIKWNSKFKNKKKLLITDNRV